MSNPAVCFISNSSIYGVNFSIEDNLGESIHIHYGQFRVALGVEQFLQIADDVIDSAKLLFQIQGLDWEWFDEWALKKDWLDRYSDISTPQVKEIALKDLFMKESYVRKRSIKRIIPLEESGYLKVLQGVSDDLEYYREKGQYEKSREEKLLWINELIKSEGYPFEDKMILIDQEGYILDGNKRASCLINIYGKDKRIPVQCIDIKWDKGLEKRQEEAERKIEELGYIGNEKKDISMNNDYQIYQLAEIFKKLNQLEIAFFVIRRERVTQNGKKIVADVILDSDSLQRLKMDMVFVETTESPYPQYTYLYAVEKPIELISDEGYVLISSKICVKSKFKPQIVPLESGVEQWIRKETQYNKGNKCLMANEKVIFFTRIIDCMLEKERFDNDDRSFISRNKCLLQDEGILRALEMEFFAYSNELIRKLLDEDYESALAGYISFANY